MWNTVLMKAAATFFKCNHVSKFNGEFSSGNRFALSVECALMLPIEQGASVWLLSSIISYMLLDISLKGLLLLKIR